MSIGDIVRNKKSGQRGKVVYSTFGVSVISLGSPHWQTLGMTLDEAAQYWEVDTDGE